MLAVPAKPNIVYIMADDLGYGELGCYGQEKIPTPNIDRIAAEGVKFTRFYSASPVCAPTRYSLLTGKHQGHAAIRGNKEAGGFGPNDKEGQFPIPKTDVTIAEVLNEAGYRTALVGKWGLGGPEPGQSPLDHGFDHFYGYLCQRRAHNYYPAYLWNDRQPDLLAGNRVFSAHQKIEGPLSSSEEYFERFAGKDFAPEKMVEDCRQFIKQSKTSPFFLYYAPTLPHVALQAPKEWIDKFPREWDTKPYLGQSGYLPSERPRATYAAMIAYLDFTVGELLKELEANGLAENTLVIFTSDNGATFTGGMDRAFFRSNGDLRDGKMSVYEGGIRVPLVAKWPGRIAAGTKSDAISVCYDTFATLADIVGAKTKTDGRSYLPALIGGIPMSREFAYFEYPEANSQRAILFDRYKAVWPNLKKDSGLVELYDLEADPSEKIDLAKSKPDLVRRSRAIASKEHVPNADFPLPGVDSKN